jgi:CcmD family protein
MLRIERIRGKLQGALALFTTWLWTAAVLAQDAAAERATSFQAVQGAVKEDVPGGPLLVGAYAVVWVFVLLFVVRVVRQQQQSQRDLTRLESLLAKAKGGQG